MTLEAKSIIKEGWLTVFKSRKPTFFSSKPVPDKLLDRGWAVLHQFSSKGPVISFYQVPSPSTPLCPCWSLSNSPSLPPSLSLSLSLPPSLPLPQDNRKESRVMKREKIELWYVRQITCILQHPKQPHCLTLRFKGTKRILLNADTE